MKIEGQQPPQAAQVKALTALRDYWDADAATYNDWGEHGAWSLGEQAAWAGTLSRYVPTPRARILDVGAGTGFLSLVAARLGHRVTALDISETMLAHLREAAAGEQLEIETICCPADQPPPGPFDVVMERLALWTLPDPERALTAWHKATPGGQLLAFQGLWGAGRDYAEGVRRRGRKLLQRLRRLPPEHHEPYPAELRAALPLAGEPSPNALIDSILAAGWSSPRLTRLHDVEWARQLALPPLDRLLGVTPEYLIAARA